MATALQSFDKVIDQNQWLDACVHAEAYDVCCITSRRRKLNKSVGVHKVGESDNHISYVGV